MESISKAARQGRILDLIRGNQIHTQNDLLDGLRKFGIDATQVTVSRDLHELGIVKTASGYQALGNSKAVTLSGIVREFLLAAIPAQNIVVASTSPGSAMTVAKALDMEAWPEIVGTVAGDDTIFIVAPDSRTAKRVAQKLLKLK